MRGRYRLFSERVLYEPPLRSMRVRRAASIDPSTTNACDAFFIFTSFRHFFSVIFLREMFTEKRTGGKVLEERTLPHDLVIKLPPPAESFIFVKIKNCETMCIGIRIFADTRKVLKHLIFIILKVYIL